jgi:hypothetical protein
MHLPSLAVVFRRYPVRITAGLLAILTRAYWFSSLAPEQCPDSAFKEVCVTTTFFQILTYSTFLIIVVTYSTLYHVGVCS